MKLPLKWKRRDLKVEDKGLNISLRDSKSAVNHMQPKLREVSDVSDMLKYLQKRPLFYTGTPDKRGFPLTLRAHTSS